jgi:cobalt-zinc-cadmium efflux system outer membrane protein
VGKLNKFRQTKWILGVGLFLLAFSHSFAQQKPAGKIYTLPMLVDLSLQTNPSVFASNNSAQAAAGQARSARAIPNPDIEAMQGKNESRPTGTQMGNVSSWTITQPLDMPYNRVPRVNAADATASAALANHQAFEIETAAKVQLRFYEMIKRASELEAANEDLNLTKQIRDRVKLRYEVGETAKFDLIRAETEFLNAQKNAEAARLRAQQARNFLRAAVGPELPENFQLKFEDIAKVKLPALERLIEELKEQSPELRKFKAETQAAESKLSFEKNQRLPSLALKIQQDLDPDIKSRRYGLVMNIPIWDFRSGKVAEASANLDKARNLEQANLYHLERQMESTYRLYEISSYQVNLLENELIVQASSARKIAEAAYRYGERGILEFLDAQRTFRLARLDLINAKYELATVITEINRLRAHPELTPSKETAK